MRRAEMIRMISARSVKETTKYLPPCDLPNVWGRLEARVM